MISDSFCLDLSFKDRLFFNAYLQDGVVTGAEFSSLSCKDRLESKEAKELKEDIKDYFQGYKTEFKEYCVELRTTDFVRKVLNEVRDIHYGETVTYGELASKLDSAPRAIGQAMKRNPIPVIIPCHRVVGSSGLGGFSSGVDIKKELLKLESATEQDRWL